jgi:GNAT superfamily N-acetyltransferase
MTGQTIVRHYDTLMNSPGLILAVRCWHELLLWKFIDPGATAVQYDHKAFVAFQGETEVGVLTYAEQGWSNSVYIGLAYVVPACRRQGIHTAMWNAMIAKARELKRPAISSSTALGNTAMRNLMKKQGRVETSVNTRFVVPAIEKPIA